MIVWCLLVVDVLLLVLAWVCDFGGFGFCLRVVFLFSVTGFVVLILCFCFCFMVACSLCGVVCGCALRSFWVSVWDFD